jgi:hypothetical protein
MIVRSERSRLPAGTPRQIVPSVTGIAAIPAAAGLLGVRLLQYRIQEYACGCFLRVVVSRFAPRSRRPDLLHELESGQSLSEYSSSVRPSTVNFGG